MGAKILPPTGFPSPHRPTRSDYAISTYINQRVAALTGTSRVPYFIRRKDEDFSLVECNFGGTLCLLLIILEGLEIHSEGTCAPVDCTCLYLKYKSMCICEV
jgi:hypothetical protein